MPRLSPELLETALHLTAKRLEQLDGMNDTKAVCSGHALLAIGLVQGTTNDVDVLAAVDPDEGACRSAIPSRHTFAGGSSG